MIRPCLVLAVLTMLTCAYMQDADAQTTGTPAPIAADSLGSPDSAMALQAPVAPEPTPVSEPPKPSFFQNKLVQLGLGAIAFLVFLYLFINWSSNQEQKERQRRYHRT